MNKMQKALHELSEMDELAARRSPVHSLHPAAKLITTIVYILVTLSFDKYDLSGLVPMVLCSRSAVLMCIRVSISFASCCRWSWR